MMRFLPSVIGSNPLPPRAAPPRTPGLQAWANTVGPSASTCSLSRTPGAARQGRQRRLASVERLAPSRRRRARSVRQLVACRPRRTSYRPGRSGAVALGSARTFRQHRRQTCRSRDRLPSRASCRIYILSGSRPPHRLPRWQDRHVHLAHDRYCPCRCGQCAFPSRRFVPPTDHGAAGRFGRC